MHSILFALNWVAIKKEVAFLDKNLFTACVMYTVLQMFRQFGLFIVKNAYVPEGGTERGRGATHRAKFAKEVHKLASIGL